MDYKQPKATTSGSVAPITIKNLPSYITAGIKSITDKTEIKLTEYGKTCATTAISAVVAYVSENSIDPNKIEMRTLCQSIQSAGILELNIASYPAQLFVDYHKPSKDGKKGTIRLTVQGAGWETLVSKWGDNLATGGLKRPWEVREGDYFSLPAFNGIELTPPTWQPSYNSSKKVLYVVYPIVKKDNTVEYLIVDRESVKANLVAHIHNGNRYISNEVMKDFDKASESLTFDELLSALKEGKWPELKASPAWTSPSSSEAMIIRKMKNNALKKVNLIAGDRNVVEAIKAVDEVDEKVIDESEAMRNETPHTIAQDFDLETLDEEGEKLTDDETPSATSNDDEEEQEGVKVTKEGNKLFMEVEEVF